MASEQNQSPDGLPLISLVRRVAVAVERLREDAMAIEEEFDISIPFNANEPTAGDFDISSVAAIVRGIEGLIAEKA